jgi:hypothetical protein
MNECPRCGGQYDDIVGCACEDYCARCLAHFSECTCGTTDPFDLTETEAEALGYEDPII